MSELTDLPVPYKRKWVDPREYDQRSLYTMLEIKQFFTELKRDNLRVALQLLINILRPNFTEVLIIVNGRTSKWISSERLIFVSYGGIRWPIDEELLNAMQTLCIEGCIQLVYSIEEKIYVYHASLNNIYHYISNQSP